MRTDTMAYTCTHPGHFPFAHFRLGQTIETSNNLTFSPFGSILRCLARFWFPTPSKNTVFSYIFVSPQGMLRNHWVFWLFDFMAIMARHAAGGGEAEDASSEGVEGMVKQVDFTDLGQHPTSQTTLACSTCG